MDFYVINTRCLVGSEFHSVAEALERQRGEAPRCPACRRYIASMPWLPPYQVKLRIFGKYLGDVTYELLKPIWSERFRRGFQRAELTGLEFHPVDIIKTVPKRVSPTQPYYYAPVLRGRAAIDVEQSGLERGPVQCAECRLMMQVERTARIVIEEGTWDGLDIFIARGLPGTRIVTSRFKAMCDSEKITGLILTPAEEYSFDSMPWTKVPLSPL